MLSELGKKSRKSQEAAIKKKELNKLYAMNYIFAEGAFKALMTDFVESNYVEENFNPTVDDFVKHCVESSNCNLTALFYSLYYYIMPSIVKRLGLRLHRSDIADGGSALGNEHFYLIGSSEVRALPLPNGCHANIVATVINIFIWGLIFEKFGY
jgi:hypothetical protein